MKVFKAIISGISTFMAILILPQIGFYILGIPINIVVKEAGLLVYVAIVLGCLVGFVTLIALYDAAASGRK